MSAVREQAKTQFALSVMEQIRVDYEREYARQYQQMARYLSFDDLLKPAPGRGCGYSKFSPKGRARRS